MDKVQGDAKDSDHEEWKKCLEKAKIRNEFLSHY